MKKKSETTKKELDEIKEKLERTSDEGKKLKEELQQKGALSTPPPLPQTQPPPSPKIEVTIF